MTHLDVYDTLDEVKACIAYDINGVRVEDFPASIEALNHAKPVLKSFSGWKKKLSSVSSYGDMPQSAKEYIEFIEKFCETPVDIVSVGYERTETIIRKSPWV
jgi:adenylosuccinate synthase